MIVVLESLTYMIGIGGRGVGTEVKLMRLFLTFLNYKECYKNCVGWCQICGNVWQPVQPSAGSVTDLRFWLIAIIAQSYELFVTTKFVITKCKYLWPSTMLQLSLNRALIGIQLRSGCVNWYDFTDAYQRFILIPILMFGWRF